MGRGGGEERPVVEDIVRVGENGREAEVGADSEEGEGNWGWDAGGGGVGRRGKGVDVKVEDPCEHVVCAAKGNFRFREFSGGEDRELRRRGISENTA